MDDPKPSPFALNRGRIVLLILGALLVVIGVSSWFGGINGYQELREAYNAQSSHVKGQGTELADLIFVDFATMFVVAGLVFLLLRKLSISYRAAAAVAMMTIAGFLLNNQQLAWGRTASTGEVVMIGAGVVALAVVAAVSALVSSNAKQGPPTTSN